MKHYIWLNPVVISLYGQKTLDETMERLGYQIVFCEEDHLARVKERYRRETEAETKRAASGHCRCVMDMRCPAAADYARERWRMEQTDGERERLGGQILEERPEEENGAPVFPDIEPILLHAARELAGRLDFSDGSDLTVVTPCSQLRDLGNEKNLEHTRFLTWRDFSEEAGLYLTKRELSDSPIPLGFFEDVEGLKGGTVSLSSYEAIDAFFETKAYRRKRLAEMLYCGGGCHNGNGV